MARESRRHFGESISLGVQASETKEENLKVIFDVISGAREDLENFTSNKVSIKTRDSQKDTFLKAATLMATWNNNHPDIQKPTNQVIFALSKLDTSKLEDLTVLELGVEGFPCTIYVDGNRLTSADLESFEDNISTLLSSPSTGEKIKRLMNVKHNQVNGEVTELYAFDPHTQETGGMGEVTIYHVDYKEKLADLGSVPLSQLKNDENP